MSRIICLSYKDSNNEHISIELEFYQETLGGQSTSRRFWSLPILKDFGITKLTELGISDPVYFTGWEEISQLENEINLLIKCRPKIDFEPSHRLDEWIKNLVNGVKLLKEKCPDGCLPEFSIG